MPRPNIPSFNSEFDIGLFLLIAKKSLIWMILLFAFALGVSYLYLRYTPNVYQSGSVIKIGLKDNANKILNIGSQFFDRDAEKNLAGSIELIRSNIIVQRALGKLPLRTTYFVKGRVLSYELYRNTPFIVESNLSDSSAIGRPIFIMFQNELVQLFEGENSISSKVLPGRWMNTKYGKFKVTLTNGALSREEMEMIKTSPIYFVLNNTSTLLPIYNSRITVNILNEEAQTIQVQVWGNNARKTADLANALTEEFNQYDYERKGEGAEQTVKFIDDQLQSEGTELRRSETLLEGFKRSNRILTPETDAKTASSKFNDLENDKVKLELESNVLEKLEQDIVANKQFNNLIPTVSEYQSSGALSSIVASIQKLEDDKEQLLQQATAQSNIVKQVNAKIESKKNLLIETIKLTRKGVEDKIAGIENTLKQYNAELDKLPSKEAEYARIERLFTIHEKFYSMLLEKKAEFLITKAGLVTDNIILQKASTPESPISPNRSMIYIYALAVGFIGSVILILIRYLLHNEITSVEDIKSFTSAPILGVIPKYKENIPHSELIVDKNPKSMIAEAFRSVRANLQFISNEPGTKLMAVTSTISGEGKTFVSINLAGVMSFSGKRVILLDLDLRKPRIHLGFDASNDKGMSTILIGKDSPHSCIHKSALPHLDYITAGPIPPNPSELILSKRMTELIDELKVDYDIIIIDTPPVGIVTDGIPILQMVDYPLYIMRANYSKKQLISNINKLIEENQVKNLSIILNSQDNNRGGYNYGYGGGYGYGYGYGYYDEENNNKKMNFLKRFFK